MSSSSCSTRRSRNRGRRRARQHQDQASAVQRSGGPAGDPPADRSFLDREVHLWPHRACHRELPQQPGTLPLQEHKFEFNIEKANQILEAAGWKKGSDGIRAKDGKALKFVYQTSINAPRQKTQAIIKQACQKAGIDVELKSVVGSVFFSSDTANPDTYPHFYADAQMFNTTMPQADPQFFMNQYVSWQIANKDNKWQGRNVSRWTSKEYDEVYKQCEQELDVVKRAALFIRLNDLVCRTITSSPARPPEVPRSAAM
jgi:peptide/nickel transport system substrate-binding protein